jgi:hypothetical protein
MDTWTQEHSKLFSERHAAEADTESRHTVSEKLIIFPDRVSLNMAQSAMTNSSAWKTDQDSITNRGENHE